MWHRNLVRDGVHSSVQLVSWMHCDFLLCGAERCWPCPSTPGNSAHGRCDPLDAPAGQKEGGYGRTVSIVSAMRLAESKHLILHTFPRAKANFSSENTSFFFSWKSGSVSKKLTEFSVTMKTTASPPVVYGEFYYLRGKGLKRSFEVLGVTWEKTWARLQK